MKNQSYAFIVLIGLSCIFGIVSIIVYLSRGQNHYFLKKKLAIGAAIITLTSIASCTRPPLVTCYKPAPPPPTIESKDSVDRGVIIIHDDNRSLKFGCDRMYYSGVYFKVLKDEELLQIDNCKLAKDSSSNIVEFTVNLDENISPGRYKLDLFYGEKPTQDEGYEAFRSFRFTIEK